MIRTTSTKSRIEVFNFDEIVNRFGVGRANWLVKYIPFARIIVDGNRKLITFCENADFLINWKNSDEWYLETFGPTEDEITEILAWSFIFASIKENKKYYEIVL